MWGRWRRKWDSLFGLPSGIRNLLILRLAKQGKTVKKGRVQEQFGHTLEWGLALAAVEVPQQHRVASPTSDLYRVKVDHINNLQTLALKTKHLFVLEPARNVA
jgi:hypothetical protein